MFGEFCGGIEVSLAKCRSSAAAPVFYERDFKAERFEHFHRCNADVRLVIPHKGVVPKNDLAAACRWCGGCNRRGSGDRRPCLAAVTRRRPTMCFANHLSKRSVA